MLPTSRAEAIALIEELENDKKTGEATVDESARVLVSATNSQELRTKLQLLLAEEWDVDLTAVADGREG